MYAQSNGGMLDNKLGAPILDVDIFGIPAAFLHGLFGYQYRSDALVLEPTLPGGVTSLMQKFPVRFGNSSLFLSMEGFPPPPTPPPPPPPPGRPSKRWSCQLFGCTCQGASYLVLARSCSLSQVVAGDRDEKLLWRVCGNRLWLRSQGSTDVVGRAGPWSWVWTLPGPEAQLFVLWRPRMH
jgi:hypothetical protein